MTDVDKRWERRQKAAQRRRQLRERAVLYMGNRCGICGYNKCLNALDFHHLDGSTKDFSISERLTSWKRIKPELDKCVLLCCRCHREVHDGLHPSYLIFDDDQMIDLGETDDPLIETDEG